MPVQRRANSTTSQLPPRPNLSGSTAVCSPTPVIVRAVGGIAIGCAVLAWPDRTDRILVRLLGVAFIWIAVSALWTAVHHRALTAIRVFTAVGGAAAGGFLIRWPEQSEITLGRLVGASLVLLSIRTYWVRRKDPETKVRGVRLTASAISGHRIVRISG